MTLDEEDEFIQRIMANRDAAVAATAESKTQTSTSKGTLVEREVEDSDEHKRRHFGGERS
jgi:hypothetical protein